MAENSIGGVAARRAAHALVHSLGGVCIHLHMPALPIADDDGEELGLRSPEFQSLPFTPVAVRRRGTTAEVLIPGDVMEAGLGVQGDGAVQAAVPAGSTVELGDELFTLAGIEPVATGGGNSLYRLLLQQPATEVV